MARSGGSEAHDEMDDILNEVLDLKDEDYDEDEPEAEPTEVEDETPEPVEDEPEEAEPDEPEDEEPLAAEADEPESEAPEVEPEGKADEKPEDARAAGLLREVTDLRRKLAEAKAQASRAVQQEPVAPPTPQRSQVPIILSEDGQSLYADPDATRAEIERVARELIAEDKRPSPQQLKAYEIQMATDQFVRADPERHAPVVERSNQADDYLALQFESLASQGYQIKNTTEFLATMRQLGVDKQVETYFPEVAPMLDEFVEGMASGNATWRRSILTRMAGQAEPQHEGQTPSPVRPITGLPQSMSRKGGSRSQSPSSDDAEFLALESRMHSDVFTFLKDDKKYNRLQQLGKKLGKAGYE